jgi:outer membrane protein insertion porin family
MRKPNGIERCDLRATPALLLLCLWVLGLNGSVCAQESNHQSPQTQTRISVEHITFHTQNHLSVDAQEDIAASLKQRTYNADSDWIREFEQRVTDSWQQHGYFKTIAKAESQPLGSDSNNRHVAVTVHIDEGQQYRLGDISFVRSTAFPEQRLRGVFPMEKGDIFDAAKVRTGLEELRRLYPSKGHINATVVPEVNVEVNIGDAQRTVSLIVLLNEGKI